MIELSKVPVPVVKTTSASSQTAGWVPVLDGAGGYVWQAQSGSGGGTPAGAAGGISRETYPNPGVAKLAGVAAASYALAANVVPTSQKGAAGGVATLDGTSRLTGSQLPAVVGQPRIAANSLFGGVPVGSRATNYATTGSHGSNGTDAGQNTRTLHLLSSPVSYVRLVYVNRQDLVDAEPLPSISIVLKAAIEVPSGSFRPVTFRGQRSITLDPGGMAVSDPIAVGALAAGTTIRARSFVSTPGGSSASGAGR